RTSPQAQPGPATRRNHPLLVELYRQSLVYFLRDRQPPVHLVEAWWGDLSADDRATLMREVPLVIGNLDGVPINARIAANAQSAQHFAEMPDISIDEQHYWQRVADGSVTLVVSDPAQSRIVEMIGELGPHTTKVLTYVPGTGTQMKHFFQGEAQQVSRYLVARSASNTVAFVYKDGSWVSWVGENSNTHYEFLHELGQGVQRFQSQVIDREPSLGDVDRVAAGHSAGVTVLSAAEIAGAEFDLVVSLGGSYLLQAWQPEQGTNYHHFQYENDLINRIDQGRLHTPHELDQIFEPHIFDSNGRAQLHSHSRVAQGPATNSAVLRELARVLEEKGP
ncbi:MAG: hypothetical protein GX862_07370, partial [Leucobacter sp.]|nr:hypothetical protein [Leucobacter sp.]